jgi:hypothetical protein
MESHWRPASVRLVSDGAGIFHPATILGSPTMTALTASLISASIAFLAGAAFGFIAGEMTGDCPDCGAKKIHGPPKPPACNGAPCIRHNEPNNRLEKIN